MLLCYCHIIIITYYYHMLNLCLSDSAIDLFIEFENDSPRRRIHYYLENSKHFVVKPCFDSNNDSVVECRHVRSNRKCQLNFGNNIGVYNSQHLFYLLNLDRRIYSLAVLVKYWMKVNSFIDSRGLSSYATLWLIIFYLQQLEYPILATIEKYQENIPPNFIRTANLALNTGLKYSTSNSQTVFELLHGFFDFYAEFDFENHFVSPLFGESFPKKISTCISRNILPNIML